MKKNYHFLFLIFILLFFANIDTSAQVTADSVITTSIVFKAPPGITQYFIECWGGGGRGAKVNTNGGFAGGGGGGGAYANKYITLTPGNNYNAVVGKGAGANNTTPGGNSYFQQWDNNWVGAVGGNSCGNNTTTGASGGSAASSFGDVTRSGGNGANANYGSLYGGGGGSSGGLSSDGADGSGATGGTAPSGGGDGGNGRSGSQGAGTAGSIPGGGGGGALSTSSNDYNAGIGAKGLIKLTWCVPVSLTGTSAEGTCASDGTTTVTLTGDAAKLPIATYTVTYNRSNPAATGLTATMTVSAAGSGTFTATGFTTAGTQTITITKLESDWCAWTISANNTANVIVSSSFALTGVSATETCPSDGTITVTTSGNATDLPVGSYTVTYNRSNPAATGLTATMTVSVAGTGTFTGTGFTTAGSPTLTITNLAKGACSNSISSNNVATVNVKTFALTSSSATNTDNCSGSSTVTLNGNAGDLPVGSYTVTYSRSNPSATGLTATMTVSVAGTGTFTATGLTTIGAQTITVTKLEKGSCWNNISANNVANLTVSALLSLTGTSASGACPTFGETTVTLTANAANLPTGNYTVTYNRSNPAATGLTASMTVSVAGTGTFTATGFTVLGSPTITVTNLDKGTCGNSISANNTATVSVKEYALTGSSATNTCSGSTTVTLSANASDLPTGSYTVTYTRSNPYATGLTSTMTVSVAGTGTFTATGYNTTGNQSVTVTKLEKGSCWTNISANNVANFTVTAFSISSLSATSTCAASGSSTVTVTSTAIGLPTGSYTVTYNRSAPAATGLTATMTVSVAGTGTFTATGFTTNGEHTVTVTNLLSGTCSNAITLNNTATVRVLYYFTSAEASSVCTDDGTSNIKLYSTATGLPTGTYTVTYSRSSPAASGLTATMTVDVAGFGQFGVGDLVNAGNQTITITGLNMGGCNSNLSVNNTVPVLVSSAVPAQPSAITGQTYSCVGQSQTYSVTNVAGVTYYWQLPSQWTITAGEFTNSVTCTVGDAGGIIRVTPFNGCTGPSRSLTITQISPSIAITNLSSPCGKDGAIVVTPAGGSGSYSYAWSTGATTSSITNLYKGTYNVTITDNVSGCSKTFVNILGTTSYNNICSTKEGTVTTSGLVNSFYGPSASGTYTAGSNSITLGPIHTSGNSTNFSAGDLALIIQMQGATMDTSNTPSWGTVSNVVAGKYEYVYVSSFNTGTGVLDLSTGLVNTYIQDRANGYTFQVIRVPQYFNLTLNGNLTVLRWRGNATGDAAVGGIIAIDVANNLNFNGKTIDAGGAGFRGGAGYNYGSGSGLGKNTDYSFYSASNGHNYKGEGIAGTPKYIYNGGGTVLTGTDYPHGKGKGRGAAGNAGGSGNDANLSGNDQNSGGGGGANVTAGGMGGCPWRYSYFVKILVEEVEDLLLVQLHKL